MKVVIIITCYGYHCLRFVIRKMKDEKRSHGLLDFFSAQRKKDAEDRAEFFAFSTTWSYGLSVSPSFGL